MIIWGVHCQGFSPTLSLYIYIYIYIYKHWICHAIFLQECSTILELRLVRESELVFVHIFDLQICFVGVYPTRQDLDDNVNSWVFIYHSLEITIIRCFLVKICLHAYKCSQVMFFC